MAAVTLGIMTRSSVRSPITSPVGCASSIETWEKTRFDDFVMTDSREAPISKMYLSRSDLSSITNRLTSTGMYTPTRKSTGRAILAEGLILGFNWMLWVQPATRINAIRPAADFSTCMGRSSLVGAIAPGYVRTHVRRLPENVRAHTCSSHMKLRIPAGKVKR